MPLERSFKDLLGRRSDLTGTYNYYLRSFSFHSVLDISQARLMHSFIFLCVTLQIFKALQVNYRKMMVDVTRKTYYSLVAHRQIVGFSCYSYMKLQVCTVIYDCYYNQTIRVQSGQCRMPLLLQAKYLQCCAKSHKCMFR